VKSTAGGGVGHAANAEGNRRPVSWLFASALAGLQPHHGEAKIASRSHTFSGVHNESASAPNAAVLALLRWTHSASAAPCGGSAAGFGVWLDAFKQEAAADGFSLWTIDAALADVSYDHAVISRDRGQKVFIHRDIADVFDLLTTPKNWPEWHPASISVAGATDHSLAIGEGVTRKSS
jgi:membrane-bound lytic murein transglycosylase B